MNLYEFLANYYSQEVALREWIGKNFDCKPVPPQWLWVEAVYVDEGFVSKATDLGYIKYWDQHIKFTAKGRKVAEKELALRILAK